MYFYNAGNCSGTLKIKCLKIFKEIQFNDYQIGKLFSNQLATLLMYMVERLSRILR